MNYGLMYYSEFKSINNTHYRVEFHGYNYTGESQILTLSSNPFIAEWESEDIYKPLKMSNATIGILSGKILPELYTGKAQGVLVKLINKSAYHSPVEWFGFVTPNLYSSEYKTVLDEITIEAVDTISCLDNVKYSTIYGMPRFWNFWEIIRHCIQLGDKSFTGQRLVVLNANCMNNSAQTCLLAGLYIHERNFFDEGGEPMSCRDVVEALMSYIGTTLIQWKDSYFVVDYDAIGSDKAFTAYFDLNDGDYVDTDDLRNSKTYNIRDIGIYSSNGNISLDEVYNQVSIVANSNPVEEYIPALFDSEDLAERGYFSDYYELVNRGDYKCAIAFFNSENNWSVGLWRVEGSNVYNVDKMTTGLIGRVNGGFFQKCASYEIKDGAPSSFNWQTYFTFACRKGVDNNIYYSPLSLRKEIPVVAYYGNLILNFHYKFTEYSIADSNAESLDVTFPTDHTDTFRCLLKIGDYYYNGKSWVYDNVGNPQPFSIKCKYKAGDKVFDTLYSPENKVTFYLKLSDATDGIPIGLTNHILNGKIEFKLYPPSLMGTTYGGHTILNCHIQDLSLICTGRNHKHDIFGRELDNSEDIVYSNVIDEKNAIEGEERQLLVNSFTDGIVSYSNVATKEGDNFYYIKETNIYNGASDSRRLPEHLLIDKLYRHYSTPKFIYRNSLMYKFSPFDRIKENSLNKTLLVNSLSVDYANDSVDVTLIEL